MLTPKRVFYLTLITIALGLLLITSPLAQETQGEPQDPAESAPEQPAAPAEEAPGLKVTATICTAVEDRDPLGEGVVFPAGVEKLFCHTLVEGAEEPTSVTHVWYYGEKNMAEVILSVNSPHWRTWSSKRIVEGWTGDWHVDILDEAGATLTSIAFQIE